MIDLDIDLDLYLDIDTDIDMDMGMDIDTGIDTDIFCICRCGHPPPTTFLGLISTVNTAVVYPHASVKADSSFELAMVETNVEGVKPSRLWG